MTLINGGKVLGENQQACAELLEEALEQANQGKIHAVGIIVCMEGGYASVMAGSAAADLNLGCDSLKQKILGAVEGGNRAEPARRSSILRPR